MEREAVLEALEDHIQETNVPVASSPELADRLDLGRRRVLQLLELLEAAGQVQSHRIGSGRAWWPADLLERHGEFPPAEPPAEPVAEPPAETPPESEPAPVLDDLQEQLAQLDLPGSGTVLEERREAVRACYLLVQERGTAQKKDFINEIYPDHSARYGSEGGWWNAIGKQGLQQLAEQREDLSAPATEGSRSWES